VPLSQGFAAYVEELIAAFGPVQIRKMFGGAAVYRDGVGFGILDDDTFFIKADKAFGAELKRQGCRPWVYSIAKDGSVRDVAYWSLPETAADDGDEASSLVRRSYQIAVKAAESNAAKKAKKPAKAEARTKAVSKRSGSASAAAKKPVSKARSKR
jgi:DNA transformation protein and related proteins